MSINRRLFRWAASCLSVLAIAGATTAQEVKDSEPLHGQDIAGNWDPDAAMVTLEPATDINPVRTQHVLIATVTDKHGNRLGGRRVEWILPMGTIGTIVDVDRHAYYSSDGTWNTTRFLRDQVGQKLDNNYAISHTAKRPEVITFGTPDPADDIVLEPGQTWCAITSAIEGTTDVVAYVPGIYNWEKHKAFAQKHWMDVGFDWPMDATNRVGTEHVFSTGVHKYSDKTALAGYQVTYEVLDGPPATFDESGETTLVVEADANGVADATLVQAEPTPGTNTVEISVMRPGNEACCIPPKFITSYVVEKTWLAPSISIEKTAPAQAAKNETFDYTIVVSNAAKVSTRETTVTDTLPDGIEFVSASPSATRDGQELSWNLGTVGAGASRSITVKVRATRTGEFRNCAKVTAEAGLMAEDCAPTVVVAPALDLTKTGPAEVILCDTITYTLTVKNSGDGPATNVTIRDSMPEGLSSDGRRTVDIPVGTLGAGEMKTFTVTAKASRTGEFTNTARVTAAGGLEDEASVTTTVRQPVLAITKTGTERSFIGRPVTYQVTVENTGDAPSRNTVLVDTLPSGASFTRASDGGTHAAGQVRWNLGTMAPGASRTVSVTVSTTAAGTLVNRAAVQGDCAPQVTAEARTTVVGVPALLLEVIDVEDPIEVDSNVVYEISVTNQGTAVDTQIVIEATLPPELTFVGATGPTQHSASGQTLTFAPVASLAPGAKVTYRVTARANAAGDVRFALAMNSAELTSSVNETEATRLY